MTASLFPTKLTDPRAYALGNLHDRPLRELAEGWRRTRGPQFSRVCRRAFEVLRDPAAPPFVNLYDVLAGV